MEKEIIEGNKLIAEFMVGKAHTSKAGVYVNREVFIISEREYPTDWLEFHSSWNWLIPVAWKCKNMGFFPEDLREVHSEKWVQIRDSLVKMEISDVWLSVVEFIKWYNQKNKK